MIAQPSRQARRGSVPRHGAADPPGAMRPNHGLGRPRLSRPAVRAGLVFGRGVAAVAGCILAAGPPTPAPGRPGHRRSPGAARLLPAGSLAPFLPWADEAPRPWPGWRRLPRAAPFVVGYLATSWLLFVPLARPAAGNVVIDYERVGPLLFRIPDLRHRPSRALANLATAPWLNHNLVQLAYVSGLLLLVGPPFEAREGTARTAGLFFGTSVAGAVAAGLGLHVLYPRRWDTPFAEKAWRRTWSGVSAGVFGLTGAVAARARVPWPLLGLVVLWEANLVRWYLREYTPAFHLGALLAGFVATRYALPPRRRDPPAGDAPASTRP